ncbi:hypothetical protein [Rhizobium leguminosarum]|uniref:hypothetical protein n=1 Tax=Rhizobium leguminosarum TaxID=384 RepID=UPI00103E4F1F|nr:hypothetical protein [Rhizobium leguminosarum]TCA89200.1 hypothetical protein E0H76_31430 [Rhizobium leguminosarum bv. viciae]
MSDRRKLLLARLQKLIDDHPDPTLEEVNAAIVSEYQPPVPVDGIEISIASPERAWRMFIDVQPPKRRTIH